MQLNDARFDHILTRGAAISIQNIDDFAVLKSFNMINVEGDLFQYKIWRQNEIPVNNVEARAPGAHYKRVSHNVQTKTGTCQDFGLEEAVDKKLQKELGEGALQGTADILYQQGLINMEIAMFNTFFDPAAYDYNQDGVGGDFTVFNDAASNPIQVVRDQIMSIARRHGVKPNTITATADVANALLQNAEIKDILPTDSLRLLDHQKLAQVFGVDNFNVSGVVSAANSQADADFIDSGKLLIHHKTPLNPRLKANSGLIAVSNTAQDVVGTNGIGMLRYYEIQTNSDVVRVDLNYDMVIPATFSGALLRRCLS